MLDSPGRLEPASHFSSNGDRVARDVADFYDRLVFPSRSSHAEYQEMLPRRSGERLGDFGCGQSLFYETFRDYTPSPTFLDISINALGTIDHGLRICADLGNLPIRDASYDRVFCIGVVHHLPERGRVFREISRVIAPGGTLFLGVYAPRSLQNRLKRWHDASKFWGWQAFFYALTAVLTHVRYLARGRFLTVQDVHRRTVDFLKVPFVHYADPDEYAVEARPAGLEFQGVRRISAMNILQFKRAGGERAC